MVMTQLLWKAYIDMEVGEGQRDAARKLYERLLQRTGHVKVLSLRFGNCQVASSR